MITHRNSFNENPVKPPYAGRNCQAVFILSLNDSQSQRNNADDQTSDCKEYIEKLNITHLHHLRFCTPSRRKTTRRPYLPTRLIISQQDKKFNQYLPSPIAFTTSYGAPIIRAISGYFKPWLWSVLIFLSNHCVCVINGSVILVSSFGATPRNIATKHISYPSKKWTVPRSTDTKITMRLGLAVFAKIAMDKPYHSHTAQLRGISERISL